MRFLFYLFLMLLLVVLVGWTPLCAQEPIRIGMNIGLNLANQSNSQNIYSNQSSSRIGLVAGGVVELRLNENFYILAEPGYIQKGMKIPNEFVLTGPTGPEPIGYADFVVKMEYVQVPILLKAAVGMSDVTFVGFGGLNVGFLISAKHEMPGGLETSEPTASFDMKSIYKPRDVCVEFGGGIEYRISEIFSLIGNARYSQGVQNINNLSSSNNIAKSNGVQIVFGLLVAP